MLEVVRKMRSIMEKKQMSRIKGLMISSKCFIGNVKLGNDGGEEEINLCLTADENTSVQVVVLLHMWIAPQ